MTDTPSERPASASGSGSGPTALRPLNHSASLPAAGARRDKTGGAGSSGPLGGKRPLADTLPAAGKKGSSGGGRPDTAPNATSPSFRKPLKLSIRDIVENDTGKRPTSKNLLKSLEENVRKVMEAKRNEYDRAQYTLRQKQKELAELELRLNDLQKDGAAMGVDEAPDPDERMVPLKAISTRPIYSKHTQLQELIATLAKKKQQIEKVVHTGAVYNHMRNRLMAERVEEQKRNRDLKIELRQKQIRNQELKRDELAVSEALGRAQYSLSELKAKVERDLSLWKHEIADREAWAKQKGKFEEFVAKQVERQRELELEAQGDMAEADERHLQDVHAAALFANRRMTRKLSTTLKTVAEEEKRYEEAFRRMGIKHDSMEPQRIIDICTAQDDIRADLLRKRAAEEERVEELKNQLASAQRDLQAVMFDQERTTNRVLSDRERELNETEKMLEAERSEFQFMQATVQPVRIGIQQLAKKVLNVQVDLSQATEIEWVLSQIQQKLSKIVEETRQQEMAGNMRQAPPSPVHPPRHADTPGAGRRTSILQAGISETDATATWLMSPHNLRVRARKPGQIETDDVEDDEGDKRKRRAAAAAAAAKAAKEGSDSDNDSVGFDVDGSTKVHSRSELKKMAEIMTSKHRKSRHRARAEKDERRRRD